MYADAMSQACAPARVASVRCRTIPWRAYSHVRRRTD